MIHHFSVPPPVLVERGKESCDHVGTQLLLYASPYGSHRVWSCPHCHRIVRQDTPEPYSTWTAPVAVFPKGLEGVPYDDHRVWKMPEPETLELKGRRWLPR